MVMEMSDQNKMVVAVKGLILHKGKVLVIKRADQDDVGAGTWECVGGKVDFGENLEDALIRETKEEVGLDIIVERILYATTFKTDPTRQVFILTYLCRCEESSNVLLSSEHSDYKWSTFKQLKTLLPVSILEDFEKHHVFSLEG